MSVKEPLPELVSALSHCVCVLRGIIFLLSKMPDGEHEGNLRANELNIKQTGSWERGPVLLNMHQPLHPRSSRLLLPRLVPPAPGSCVTIPRREDSAPRVPLLRALLTDLFLLQSCKRTQKRDKRWEASKLIMRLAWLRSKVGHQ